MKTEILVSKTYEIWEEEDLEIGDTDNRGFVYEDESFTFTELVKMLQCESIEGTSNYPATPESWFMLEAETDMYSGEITNNSIHIKGLKPKYWNKLFCFLNIK